MAEEKHQSIHESSTTDESTLPKHEPAKATNAYDKDVTVTSWRDRMGRHGWWWLTGAIVVLLFLVALAAGAGYMMSNRFYGRHMIDQPDYTVNRMMHYDGDGMMGIGYGQYVETQASSGSVTTTVYNYQTGVVTAVNSDNIVIAGNGQSTTIKTNSSTQYVGGKKPVVNDTVSVVGTTTDNTITATQISVVNQ